MATKQSKKSAQSKKRVNTQKSYNPDNKTMSLPAKVLIIFFAVLMALSLMIPSISAFFSAGDSQTQTITIDDLRDSINNQYQATIDTLMTQLDADPENADLQKEIGQTYLSWAINLQYYAMTDEQTLDVYNHAKQAEEYFNSYLENNEDQEIAVTAAMCPYYYGETDTAIKNLEALRDEDPDYAGTYANLGMLYEVKGETDEAIEAYNKAIELDPDDELQAKSYAESRLSALTATEEATDDTTDTTDTTDDTTTDTTDTTNKTTDTADKTDDTADNASTDDDSTSN